MAGKAHPRDDGRQGDRSADPDDASRSCAASVPCVFLPNYDMDLARHLVAGADVWLNTPLPPMEASGTSGMKAALNGVPNLSVLDGWWSEACDEGVTGWSIGDGPDDHAGNLYASWTAWAAAVACGTRAGWVRVMKRAISRIGGRYHSQRMMRRYAAEAYLR